jgi:hypothetical protein
MSPPNPLKTTLTYLSLGAEVRSSALVLLKARCMQLLIKFNLQGYPRNPARAIALGLKLLADPAGWTISQKLPTQRLRFRN